MARMPDSNSQKEDFSGFNVAEMIMLRLDHKIHKVNTALDKGKVFVIKPFIRISCGNCNVCNVANIKSSVANGSHLAKRRKKPIHMEMVSPMYK